MAQRYQVTEITADFTPNNYCKVYKFGSCRVIVGQEPTVSAPAHLGTTLHTERWHLSISHHRRLPTWEEVREARYHFVPDEITMAMLLPPKSQYVDVHVFCYHLWEIEGEK